MTRLLLTGAGGFVGRHLMPRLVGAGHAVVTAGRARSGASAGHVVVGEIGPQTDWSRALDGCDAVVHLAAQVPGRGIPDDRYAAVNDRGTQRLVRQAKTAGVTRFILMSSIFAAVHGEVAGQVPDTPYGRSKRAAEAHVAAFAGPGRTGISLRPPLVYGAGAVGNWALLQRLAALPVPLPFGAVRNRRSVIAVDNLVDAILASIAAPDAPSGTYAVADGGTVGLADILTWLRAGMGRSPGLFPVPPGMLGLALRALGQGQAAQSLLGDLVADTTPFKVAFGWKPPLRSETAIAAAGKTRRTGR